MFSGVKYIRQSKFLSYLIAALISSLVLMMRTAVQPLLGYTAPFMLGPLAVMAAAWLGGLGPGLFTTFICTVASIQLFLSPPDSDLTPGHLFRIFIFVIQGVLISFVISGLVESRRKARLSELSLSESENQFRTMANSIPQMAWMADARGWIFWFNQRWYDFTGTQLSDVEGWGWEKVIHRDHVDRVVRNMQKSWRTGEPFEDTFPIEGKDGQWRWFLTRARPIRDAFGRVVKWFGTNTDITENLNAEAELKKARDAAESANRSKTQFLANMSHEIRTPMNAILGFSELLADRDLSEDAKSHHLSRINANGHHLLALIDDILDLSKVEAGQVITERQRFDLPLLVAEILGSMSILAERKNLKLEVVFKSAVPSFIHGDTVRVRQILTNLLSNAIKFTDHGSVKLVLNCLHHVEKSQTRLQIFVEDTGIGIPKDAQENLFKPFSQADSSVTRKYGGTGLGLSLSRRLASAMQGSLNLSWSETTVGSSFVFEFPVGDVSNEKFVLSLPQLSTTVLDSSRPQIASTGKRVLLAEDSPDLAELVKLYLNKEGLKIDVASNGEQALQMSFKNPYDVILMDVQMPVLDGLEATRQLRANGVSIPVIALTAHALPEDVSKSINAGCNAHLSKPVDRTDLIKVLRKFLDDRESNQVIAESATAPKTSGLGPAPRSPRASPTTRPPEKPTL